MLAIAANARAEVYWSEEFGAEVYRNEEFGIEIPIAEGAFLCPKLDGEHDHGPLFLLGVPDPRRCSTDNKQTRYIAIWAEHNAADVTKYLRDYFNSQCGVAGGPCGPAPDSLEITALPSASGRVNHPDGWTDVIVVTQAGKPDPAYDPSVASVNYCLGLHTNLEYMEEDLRVFRCILKTIRINPDVENKGH
jgi:hypothetical protein